MVGYILALILLILNIVQFLLHIRDKNKRTVGTLFVIDDKIDGTGMFLQVEESLETLKTHKTAYLRISHK